MPPLVIAVLRLLLRVLLYSLAYSLLVDINSGSLNSTVLSAQLTEKDITHSSANLYKDVFTISVLTSIKLTIYIKQLPLN
jgi:hypothetical protein